jgi:hypothetical protein
MALKRENSKQMEGKKETENYLTENQFFLIANWKYLQPQQETTVCSGSI